MTQDTYLDRRRVNENNLRALEAIDPDAAVSDEGDAREDERTEEAGRELHPLCPATLSVLLDLAVK